MAPAKPEIVENVVMALVKKHGMGGAAFIVLCFFGWLLWSQFVAQADCFRNDIKQCQSEVLGLSKETLQNNNELTKAIMELKMSMDRFSRTMDRHLDRGERAAMGDRTDER